LHNFNNCQHKFQTATAIYELQTESLAKWKKLALPRAKKNTAKQSETKTLADNF